jgi:hypothetical protein
VTDKRVKKSERVVTESMRNATKAALAGESMIVIGGAGTGKTQWIREIANSLVELGRDVLVVAPTATAAIRANGFTIHRAFGIAAKPGIEFETSVSMPSQLNSVVGSIDTLIIDEISMISAPMLDQIAMRLRATQRQRIAPSDQEISKHFGNRQIILVGDPFQIKPVSKHIAPYLPEFGYKSIWWFSAKSYDSTSLRHVELRDHFRQDDTEFLDHLISLRHGKTTDQLFEFFKKRQQQNDYSENELAGISLVAKKRQRDEINSKRLAMLTTEIRSSDIVWEKKPQNGESTPHEIPRLLEFKLGARVVMTLNKYNESGWTLWVNGSQGTIVGINPKSGTHVNYVVVQFDNGSKLRVERERFEEHRPLLVEISDTPGKKKIEHEIYSSALQFPFTLGWAMTIHKSQGATLEKVSADLSEVWEEGMSYVALSRTRSPEDLTITGEEFSSKHVHEIDELLANYYTENFKNIQENKDKNQLIPDLSMKRQPKSLS